MTAFTKELTVSLHLGVVNPSPVPVDMIIVEFLISLIIYLIVYLIQALLSISRLMIGRITMCLVN